MTPIEEPIDKYVLTDKQKKIKSEIEEFMAHPCQMAYVWTDENIKYTNTCVESYKSMLRKMRLSSKVKARQRNKTVYLIKIEEVR